MIEEVPTRTEGVHRRNDSNIYQFGLRAPKDLAEHYKGGWAVRCSLGTSDLNEANVKARQLRAQWDATFEQLRSGAAAPAPQIVQIAPDLGKLRAELLRRLEKLASLADAQVVKDTPEQRAERARDWGWQRGDSQQGLECGYTPDWQEEWLDRMAASLSLSRSALLDSELLKHYVAMMDIHIEALTDYTGTYPVRVAVLEARRKLIPSHSGVQAPGQMIVGETKRIADALNRWKEAADRPKKTVDAFSRHAAMFAEMMGDAPIAQWTKATGRGFRDALTAWATQHGKTAATADNVLVSVRAIAAFAVDADWTADNPFIGMAVTKGGKASGKREPWSTEELRVLFDDPIWSARTLPSTSKAGGAAAYWMPLLACYTGARISEIAQLWTDDLDIAPGSECIEIRANAERGQELKNEGSWRAVPMHRELVRLGLPDYVRTLPVGPLFPDLKTGGANGAGGVFGGWYGSFKRGKGFTTPLKTFHSFRHTVASELQLKNVSDALRNSILGHTGEGMGEKVYGATVRRNAQRLRQYVDLLDFPLTSLPAFDWQDS